MKSLWQDLQYAIRMLRKNLSFSAAALLCLALGVGANTAIFSVVKAVLLNLPPYKDPGRIVMIWERNPKLHLGFDDLPISVGDFVAMRTQSHVLEAISPLMTSSHNLISQQEPEKIGAVHVSADFFNVMGVQPQIGRGFSVDEDRSGGERVVIISNKLWQSRFAADPGIIGKPVTLDSESYTVIGVMPPAFQFPVASDLPSYTSVAAHTDLWMPARISDNQIDQRADRQLAIIARIKPGLSLQQAQSDLTALAQHLEKEYPSTNKGFGIVLVPLQQQQVKDIRLAILVLQAAVAFVLLIACANLANLMLARSAARRKEIAIRIAVGASRGRIIRQLLTESVLLSLIGGGIGLLLQYYGVHILLTLSPKNTPRLNEVHTDLSVLAFTVAISVLTGLLFGLVPAIQASKLDINETLKQSTKSFSGDLRHGSFGNLLIVAEVALSFVLLAGAGLMINSFIQLLRTGPGFDFKSVLTLTIPLDSKKYPQAQRARVFFQQAMSRVANIPGVEAIGTISQLPLSGAIYAGGFTIEGAPTPPPNTDTVADRRLVSPDYFKAMGIPMLKGRAFTDKDNDKSPGVAIISESMVRRFIPDGDPIGRRIKLGGASSNRPWLSIVGVVGDIKDSSIAGQPTPHIYAPYTQQQSTSMTLVVRTSADAAGLLPAVRREIWSLDRGQPITNVKTMSQYVAEARAPQTFSTVLLSIFALLALVLSAVGIYGVLTYSVSQRAHEIGVRMALGARQRDIMKLILKQSLALITTGVVIGLFAAVALTRLMQGLLFGVSATDPLTFACISLLLAIIALLACGIPARKASKVDPMIVLRME